MGCAIFDEYHDDHPWETMINNTLPPKRQCQIIGKVTANWCMDGRVKPETRAKLNAIKHADDWADLLKQGCEIHINNNQTWRPHADQCKGIPKQVELIHVMRLSELIYCALDGYGDSKDAKGGLWSLLRDKYHLDLPQVKPANRTDLDNRLEELDRDLDRLNQEATLDFESSEEFSAQLCRMCTEVFSRQDGGIPSRRSYLWAAIASDISGLPVGQWPHVLGLDHWVRQKRADVQPPWLIAFKYTLPATELYLPTCLEAGHEGAAHYPTHADAPTGMALDLRINKERHMVREVIHTSPRFYQAAWWLGTVWKPDANLPIHNLYDARRLHRDKLHTEDYRVYAPLHARGMPC